MAYSLSWIRFKPLCFPQVLRPFHTLNALNAHWTAVRLEATRICINWFHTHIHCTRSEINIACAKLKWCHTISSPTSYVRVSSLFSTRKTNSTMTNCLALRSRCTLTRKRAFLTWWFQTGAICLILTLVLLHASYNTHLAVLLRCYSIAAMAIVARVCTALPQ